MTISRTLKSVKEYRIFGDFSLPHPSNIELPEALRDPALDWEQAFKNFNDHDFLTIQKPIVDLNQAFKEFQTLEVRTWTDSLVPANTSSNLRACSTAFLPIICINPL